MILSFADIYKHRRVWYLYRSLQFHALHARCFEEVCSILGTREFSRSRNRLHKFNIFTPSSKSSRRHAHLISSHLSYASAPRHHLQPPLSAALPLIHSFILLLPSSSAKSLVTYVDHLSSLPNHCTLAAETFSKTTRFSVYALALCSRFFAKYSPIVKTWLVWESLIWPLSRTVFSASGVAHSVITRRISGWGDLSDFISTAAFVVAGGADVANDVDVDGGGGIGSYRSIQIASMPKKSSPPPIPCAASKKRFRHSCVSIARSVLRSASGAALNDNSCSALTAPSSRLGIPGCNCMT